MIIGLLLDNWPHRYIDLHIFTIRPALHIVCTIIPQPDHLRLKKIQYNDTPSSYDSLNDFVFTSLFPVEYCYPLP